ncbi:MAG: RNA polymerase sigma factor RpoD/SigA [Bacteroidota bacterium]
MRDLQIPASYTNRDAFSLTIYLNELAKSELISAEEEMRLARLIRLGDRVALDRLVNANLRFVVSVAKQYLHKGLSLSDLISEGNLGLIEAAGRFDETRGFKFISFAVWWIRQRILAAINAQGRLIRLPHNQSDTLRAVLEARGRAEQVLERQPTAQELAAFLELPLYKVNDALYYSQQVNSYDRPVFEDAEMGFLDYFDAGLARADVELMRSSERSEWLDRLSCLTKTERQVIILHYGLNGEEPMQMDNIAPAMNFSKERIRQLRNSALEKLRQQRIL